MHPQLAAVVDDLEAAQRRLAALAARTPADRWTVRADPGRWSVGECVAHLNLTSEAFLPEFHRGLADAARAGAPAPARYPLGVLGWLLYHMVGPVKTVVGVRLSMRATTTAAFVPAGELARAETLATFDRLQAEVSQVVRAADGLPLQRVRIRSPFDARASYNMYAALVILARHQHRHLQQADEVWGARSA